MFELHLLPHAGTLRVLDVKPEHIRKAVKTLIDAGKVPTAISLYIQINAMFVWAGTLSTNLGPDLSISDAEIDKWLENFESGIMPAGTSLNLLGMVRGLQFVQEPGLEPVCPECAIAAGARFAWLVLQLAKDPMWASKQGIQQATEAKQCKPIGANSAGNIAFKTSHYVSRLEADGVNVADAEG